MHNLQRFRTFLFVGAYGIRPPGHNIVQLTTFLFVGVLAQRARTNKNVLTAVLTLIRSAKNKIPPTRRRAIALLSVELYELLLSVNRNKESQNRSLASFLFWPVFCFGQFFVESRQLAPRRKAPAACASKIGLSCRRAEAPQQHPQDPLISTVLATHRSVRNYPDWTDAV